MNGEARDEEIAEWERRCDEVLRERNALFDALSLVIQGQTGAMVQARRVWEQLAYGREAGR